MSDPYPPEFDLPEGCPVCLNQIDVAESSCACPGCPECGKVGDPDCYPGHIPYAASSINSLLRKLGIGTTLGECFRAIERHSCPCYGLWIELADGRRFGSPNGEDRAKVNALPLATHIKYVGISGIAWDGSDWEFYEQEEPDADWAVLDRLDTAFTEALAEHDALTEAEDLA